MPIVGYLVLDGLYGGSESGVQAYGILSAGLAVMSFGTLLASIVALFKLRGKNRLIPIGGVLVSVVIICISVFIAAISMFAASH